VEEEEKRIKAKAAKKIVSVVLKVEWILGALGFDSNPEVSLQVYLLKRRCLALWL